MWRIFCSLNLNCRIYWPGGLVCVSPATLRRGPSGHSSAASSFSSRGSSSSSRHRQAGDGLFYRGKWWGVGGGFIHSKMGCGILNTAMFLLKCIFRLKKKVFTIYILRSVFLSLSLSLSLSLLISTWKTVQPRWVGCPPTRLSISLSASRPALSPLTQVSQCPCRKIITWNLHDFFLFVSMSKFQNVNICLVQAAVTWGRRAGTCCPPSPPSRPSSPRTQDTTRGVWPSPRRSSLSPGQSSPPSPTWRTRKLLQGGRPRQKCGPPLKSCTSRAQVLGWGQTLPGTPRRGHSQPPHWPRPRRGNSSPLSPTRHSGGTQ